MKLHDTIVKLLEIYDRPLSTNEISEELNQNKWYQKNDDSKITVLQIHGRTKNYAHLFKRDGRMVSLHKVYPPLKKRSNIFLKGPTIPNPKPISNVFNTEIFEKYLINDIYFKPAHVVDNLVPAGECGIYCIRINNKDSLPVPFKNIINNRSHNILYIGIAEKCLKTRFLNQELRIKGHGTFIRSLGAILGFRPLQGSLSDNKNKRNYTFTKEDNQLIIEWINNNLNVNWILFRGDLRKAESSLINIYNPLLNISKNKLALTELSFLRKKCVSIANS